MEKAIQILSILSQDNPYPRTELNYTTPFTLLGAVLLASIILYIIPKTTNIGFFLLCSYLGGVIVAEFAKGDPPTLGIGLAVLLYVGTMLRKPELSGLNI